MIDGRKQSVQPFVEIHELIVIASVQNLREREREGVRFPTYCPGGKRIPASVEET